jgi:hypothetical protein
MFSRRFRNSRRRSARRVVSSVDNVRDPGTVVPRPPLLSTQPFPLTLRYQVGNSVQNLTFIRSQLLNVLGMATATTTVNRALGGVKVRRIDIYTPQINNTTQPSSFVFQWYTSDSCPRVYTSSSSSSTSGFLSMVPPKDSLASFWNITGFNESEVVFAMDTTAGAIIDLHLSVTLANNTTGLDGAVPRTSSGLTVGVMYQAYLDYPVGTAVLAPVGYSAAP